MERKQYRYFNPDADAPGEVLEGDKYQEWKDKRFNFLATLDDRVDKIESDKDTSFEKFCQNVKEFTKDATEAMLQDYSVFNDELANVKNNCYIFEKRLFGSCLFRNMLMFIDDDIHLDEVKPLQHNEVMQVLNSDFTGKEPMIFKYVSNESEAYDLRKNIDKYFKANEIDKMMNATEELFDCYNQRDEIRMALDLKPIRYGIRYEYDDSDREFEIKDFN